MGLRALALVATLGLRAIAVDASTLDSLATTVTLYNTGGGSAALIEGVLSAGGPALEEGGVVGRLVVSNPDLFACNGVASSSTTLLHSVFMAPNGVRPIALIERSSPELADTEQCTFEEKVRAVQAAGAAAAIIFDYKEEGPLVMSYPHPDEVEIPAVFVSHATGVSLVESLAKSPSVHPITVLTAGFNNGAVSSAAAAEAAAWYSLNAEFLSFSTGYTFLFMLLIPVCVYNMVVAMRRRRKVEAIYSKIYANDELKGALLTHLLPGPSADARNMNLLPLPLPLHQAGRQNVRCLRLHAFLVLVFLCFVYEVMVESMLFDAGSPSAMGQQDETRDEAVASGYAMVVNAVVMALAILGLRILICCACACTSSVCKFFCGSRRAASAASGGSNSTLKNPAAFTSSDTYYVELPGASGTSTNTSTSTLNPIVHAGVPVELSIQEQV